MRWLVSILAAALVSMHASQTAQSLSSISLDRLIGQMIMVGFSGTDKDEYSVRKVSTDASLGRISGVVLYAKNIRSRAQLQALTTRFANIAVSNPLFIAVDEEGGQVSRIGAIAKLPSAMSIASEHDLRAARKIYARHSDELKSLGFNLNFAPVVDVAPSNSAASVGNTAATAATAATTNEISLVGKTAAAAPTTASATNEISQTSASIVAPTPPSKTTANQGSLGSRTYSSDPDITTLYASEFASALRSSGILYTLKHFPGQGALRANIHTDGASIDRYDLDHLKPFYAFVRGDSPDMVMVSHVVYPAFDAKYPACMSRRIVGDLLRERLGYDGVVISDDVLMGGLDSYKLEERVVMMIDAGVDILLFSSPNMRGTTTQAVVSSIIKDAVASGRISRARLERSYERITRLKRQLKRKRQDLTAPAPTTAVSAPSASISAVSAPAPASADLSATDLMTLFSPALPSAVLAVAPAPNSADLSAPFVPASPVVLAQDAIILAQNSSQISRQ